jgi:tetratricopeptide (TPR) repeat protein
VRLRALFLCAHAFFAEGAYKGDLHGECLSCGTRVCSRVAVAILNLHGVGSQTCRVGVTVEGQEVFATGWSIFGAEEHSWSEPQVAQVRVPLDCSGVLVLQLFVQGKMNRKSKFGEVRLPLAEALTKTTSPLWLDVEGGDKGSLGASMSGSQRLKLHVVQRFPPQVLVKLLYVPKTLGGSAALFQARRKKLLDAPLPELLSEAVKELAVPKKPLPMAPSGGVEDKYAAARQRRDSLLFRGGAVQALSLLPAQAFGGGMADDEGPPPPENSYMSVNDEALKGEDDNNDDDYGGSAAMYKAVDSESLSNDSKKEGPPRKKVPVFEAGGSNGYRSIENSALEAEMEQVMQERLPVAIRGRASSIMPRIVRGKDEWREMDSFNARFQEAVETMNMHGAQSNTRRKELIESCLTVIRLAQDFATLASQYGKTIISEHALPESKRTIKPRKDLGGVLGGEKFIVLGILFKFATDEKNLFKSLADPLEAANKIAGLELKGLKCYFSTRTPNLSFPLMALIDYKGYRLVAMSVLPIDKATLKYGSADAGRSVLTEDDDLTVLIREASLQLNLKPHLVGRKGEEIELASAADLEGHVGYDGRFYMLDFSRTMPPVHTGLKDRPDHLYQQFRPEFVRAHSTPLSADACSMFGRHQASEHDREIVEATSYLKNTHIPDVARKVVAEAEDARDIVFFSLSEALHRRGVNMRYLGLVHHELLRFRTDCRLQDISLIEMCARVVKNKLRGRMRSVLKSLKDPSEAPFNDLTMEEYNTIFGQNVGTFGFWNDYVPAMLIENFSVTREDLPEDLELYMRTLLFSKRTAGKWLLMVRVNAMTGIEIEPAVMEQLQREPKMFDRAEVLDYLDVIGLRERVKHLNIINHAKGEFYYLKGLMRHNHSSSIEYFEKAEKCLEDALHSSPTDPQLLSTMGNILFEHAKKLSMVNPHDPQVTPHLQRGKQYFQSAIRYDSNNFMIFRDYAIFLEHLEDLDGAEEYYLRSLTLNPNQMEGLRRYGAFLRTFRGDPDAATPFFDRYKVICEQFAEGLGDKSGAMVAPQSPRATTPTPRSAPSLPSNISNSGGGKKSPGRDLRRDEVAHDVSKSPPDIPKFSGHRNRSPRNARTSTSAKN